MHYIGYRNKNKGEVTGWHDEACFAVENTVMVHFRHIREKIEIEPKKPRYIKVVWGIGYKMEKFD